MAASLSELLSMLNESLFRLGERKRLNSMKEHSDDRESQAHGDLLSKIHDSPKQSARQQSVEHNGLKFWNYYFAGEHPCMDEDLPGYINKQWGEDMRVQSNTFNMPLTRVVPEIDGVGEEDREIERRWVQHVTLGQTALQKDQFEEAERQYRLALDEAEKLHAKRIRERALASKGLADSLNRQGKTEEADAFYNVTMLIDEELFGNGDIDVADEFYNIARHFVDEGKFEVIEALFEDLKERLRMSVGRNDPVMARCLNELALIYIKDQKLAQGEQLLIRCLDILKRIEPVPNYQFAVVHSNFASLYEATDRVDEAEQQYRLALEFLQKVEELTVA